MPTASSETFRRPDGAWSYRILVDGTPRLTSGPFQLQHDAERCGRHIAADPLILLDFLTR
ncbi:hypothetical protein [Sphingomonas sp. BK580]|uniref:hypothetical protein n=1 Tax=Sphingomonas sp. BK580 TaxID=2586972 RepID=UPI00160CEA00|nr:hypothetical protein [Sphingomonas sp. BK580]MBB3693040.1 hypothetical protein [Sphingomonas sp. BK580]